jgi:hypothetical protein
VDPPPEPQRGVEVEALLGAGQLQRELGAMAAAVTSPSRSPADPMFVETIVLPRPEWERWHERLRYSTDPPEALIATIVWDSGDGQVTSISVWDTPGAIADFDMERVKPIVEAEGEPSNTPRRHGGPLAFYLRH